jgi:hypothetical protein
VPEDDADLEEEEAEKLQELMEADYETGSILREKIVPRAVAWFTGEAIEMDEEDSDEESDDEDGYAPGGEGLPQRHSEMRETWRPAGCMEQPECPPLGFPSLASFRLTRRSPQVDAAALRRGGRR